MAKVWNQNAAKIDLEMQSSKAISTNQNLNSKQYEQKNTLPVFGEKLTKLSENPHALQGCCCLRWCGGERGFDLCRKHFFCLTFHTSSIGDCEKSWNALLAWAQWAGWSPARKMRHRNIGRGNNLQEN